MSLVPFSSHKDSEKYAVINYTNYKLQTSWTNLSAREQNVRLRKPYNFREDKHRIFRLTEIGAGHPWEEPSPPSVMQSAAVDMVGRRPSYDVQRLADRREKRGGQPGNKAVGARMRSIERAFRHVKPSHETSFTSYVPLSGEMEIFALYTKLVQGCAVANSIKPGISAESQRFSEATERQQKALATEIMNFATLSVYVAAVFASLVAASPVAEPQPTVSPICAIQCVPGVTINAPGCHCP
ncbi:uncharacterized protein FOMMEDRAFT_152349 [Fomitiporia mediterranea MF3/22]|uniref:uncharacterized protein n=1 Tax=Fomitiporia mediterranea (strain MF3/22) TaxID=694068 RepID=UPI000440875B|nr:uncharacterized protein FOMMEDRAFT_152349 [Fomitiporia mediterranea MF3/22]EJD07010.1 hypothetical protein FOMMEDRAFT_152349 [Fomitiporia mediterranea MF3/22]